MKNVLILSTSLRPSSNSDALAGAFGRGAEAAGHAVETIRLTGKRLEFCIGCLACQKTRRCVLGDDAVEIAEQVRRADVLAFATPVYYYEMSGQMKTLLDRMNPLYGSNYAFRDVYLLAAAADEAEEAMDGAVQGLRGWVACFPKARLAGVIRGTGLEQAGEASARTALLDEAYACGRAV